MDNDKLCQNPRCVYGRVSVNQGEGLADCPACRPYVIYPIYINSRVVAKTLKVTETFTIEEIEKAARDAVKDELKDRNAKAVIVPGHFVNFIFDDGE